MYITTSKKGKFILVTIFLLLISTQVGYCLDRHSDTTTDGSNSRGSSSSDSSGNTQTSSRSSGGSHSHESPSTATTINFNIPGDPLEYRKFLADDENNGFRRVNVEIYSKSDKPVRLNVREFIDPDLCIALPSIHGYILSTINDISLYKLGILDSLESNESITSLYRNNYIIIKNFKGYNISINSSNMIEINAFEDFASQSYNIYNNTDLFNWNSCKNETLAQFSDFKDYLEALGVINASNLVYLNATNNTSIQLSDNESNIAIISKNNNYLDKNSVLLKYNSSIIHLKYLNIKEPVVYTSQMISLNKVTIPPGSMFVFWYDIKLNGNSNFKTETVSDSIVPGVIKPAYVPLIIDNNPKFSVITRVSQSKLYLDEMLPIEFNLKYSGGESSSISIPVEFQTSPDEDYEYVKIDGKTDDVILENFTLHKNNTMCINKYIKFKHQGVQLPPGIYVNGEYYPTDKDIIVDTRFSRDPLLFAQTMALLITLILFILSNVYLYKEDKKANLYNWTTNNKWLVRGIGFILFLIVIGFILWAFCII